MDVWAGRAIFSVPVGGGSGTDQTMQMRRRYAEGMRGSIGGRFGWRWARQRCGTPTSAVSHATYSFPSRDKFVNPECGWRIRLVMGSRGIGEEPDLDNFARLSIAVFEGL